MVAQLQVIWVTKKSEQETERSNIITNFARRDAKTRSNLSGRSTVIVLHFSSTGGGLIEVRRAQRSFGDGFIMAEINDPCLSG